MADKPWVVGEPVPMTAAIEAAIAARCDELTGRADRTRSADARLFARLVAAREGRGEIALLGLSPQRLASLYDRHFVVGLPGVPGAAMAAPTATVAAIGIESTDHPAFVVAMRDWLIGLASPDIDRDDTACIATIIANACLRPDHLWRDLGLGGRDDVTAMLERFFPALVARNLDGTRWKKFLARELALATGATPGPSPGCPGCEDFGFCFPDGR